MVHGLRETPLGRPLFVSGEHAREPAVPAEEAVPRTILTLVLHGAHVSAGGR
jgi:hypothetical protein